MKRSHGEVGSSQPPLGALEFAAALNGDNAATILSVLRRFAKTVRRERRQALGREDASSHDEESENDSSSDEEEGESEEVAHKKPRKQEAWMEDTMSYNVPFVGTSVAKGDTGTVVLGQWPTGLLQAYLKASPMAVELVSTSDLIPPTGHIHKRLLSSNKQGRKLSQAIYKAYLQALAELVTAQVPIATLQRDLGVLEGTETEVKSSTKDSFVSVILRDRLAGLMAVLNEETRQGKRNSPLLAPALDILANLAATSLGAAREITRALDASLKDGTLKILLKPLHKDDKKKETSVDTVVGRDRARVACLRLATVLAEWQDAAITPFITTKGSRERKINPGILYLAVRQGLDTAVIESQQDEDMDEDYYVMVARLVRALGVFLVDADDTTSRRSLMSKRDLVNLFSGEALVHLTRVATYAPPLIESDQVLSRKDSHPDATAIEVAGIESRRIVFILLASTTQSPFLSRIHGSNHRNDKMASDCAQQLVRAMTLLLQRSGSLPMQRFLIHCLQTTPLLLSHFFKAVTVPDPKQTFAFTARMGFIFRVLREAPPFCVDSSEKLDSRKVDQVIATIVPAHLKKHVLSKALQSSNTVVVSETLKVLWALIDRFRNLRDSIIRGDEQGLSRLLAEAFVRRLPDLQALLSLRSRFDPFDSDEYAKANSVVVGLLCKVLDSYASNLPDSLNAVKFDWIKLLPERAIKFCSVTPALQLQLLNTLEKIMGLHEERRERHQVSPTAVRMILEVTMTTRKPHIYRKARSIALKMIRPQVSNDDLEMKVCLDYEMSLWVDGLPEECIEEFTAVLNSSANSSFQHSITVAGAWENASLDALLPPVCFSPLLTACLTALATASKSFAFFVCQVVTKCLLFHRHPLPLASLIVHSLADVETTTENDSEGANPVELLRDYSESLIDFSESDEKRSLRLSSLLGCLFSRDSAQSMISGSDLVRDKESPMAAARQCLHVVTMSPKSRHAMQSVTRFRAVVPLITRPKCADDSHSYVDGVLGHPLIACNNVPWSDVAYVNTVAISWLRQNIAGSLGEERMMAIADGLLTSVEKVDGEQTMLPRSAMRALLLFSLMKPYLPHSVVSRITRTTLQLLLQAVTMGSDYLPFYASLSLYWVQERRMATDPEEVSVVALDVALKTWRILAEQCQPELCVLPVLGQLEVLLSAAVSDREGKAACLLYSLLLRAPPSETIHLCLQSKLLLASRQERLIIEGPRNSSFLSGVIALDPVVFGASFLQHLARPEKECNCLAMLENGLLDEEIAVVLRCKELLSLDSFLKVRGPMMERALEALLRKSEQIREKRRGIEDGLAVLLSTRGVLQPLHFEAFIDKALTALHSKSGVDSESNPWIRLSCSLVSADSAAAVPSSTRLGSLLSIALIRTLETISSSVKRYFRAHNPQPTSKSAEACRTAFIQATCLVDHSKVCDGNLINREGPRAVTSAIKTCLKYGVAHVRDDDSSLSKNCLQFIRTLLVEAWDPSSSLHQLMSQCMLLDPSQIMAMILSHSQFHSVMSGRAEKNTNSSHNDGALLELVRLLLVCSLKQQGDELSLTNEVWHTLLSAYKAGMSLTDITLRRLFHVWAEAVTAKGVKSAFPCMENLRWKGMSQAAIADDDSNNTSPGWEWLLNGLDAARVRATLCQFPVRDLLKPGPIIDVEVSLRDTSESAPIENLEDDDEDESSSVASPSDDSSEEGLKSREDVAPANIPVIDTDEWIGPGSDNRYGPAFVLPLILGALENSLFRGTSSSNETETSALLDESLKYHDSDASAEYSLRDFVLVAQRLCEKGALSLALASLCSECQSLRKVAVATLLHLKRALDSKEARHVSNWRERPQLAMIVDSVQRGLAVRIAMRRDCSSGMQVPKLPAVSAIFLARAALIIVKPGDAMFGQMNRYFLRLDNGHGAFQDTNRLPAFISLFCSSSDEPGHARRERMWALQLLKDSFVEEYCYRMVASCHAPELLLTTFGSIVTRQADDQPDLERTLLLDTVTRLLHYGGRRAASHLIGRLGLLSWLRGQIVSSPDFDVLPSVESRLAFLRLTSKAIEKARLFLSDERSDRECLLMEARALVPLVVALLDNSLRHGFVSAQETPPGDSFTLISCETLEALVKLTKGFESDTDSKHMQRFGVALAPTTRVLQSIPKTLTRTLVWSLCTGPHLDDGDNGSENAALFCKLVLAFLAESDADVELSTAVLSRVSLVVTLHQLQPLESADEVIESLFACRSKCLSRCRDAWFECLESVVGQSTAADSETLRIARDLLNANASIGSNVVRDQALTNSDH